MENITDKDGSAVITTQLNKKYDFRQWGSG